MYFVFSQWICCATSQDPDILIFNGAEHQISVTPLEEFDRSKLNFPKPEGTTKLLINDQCDVVWPNPQSAEVNEVLPFGQELNNVSEDSPETNFNINFTNKELDRHLELNYFGARYYHPGFPRFISPDPVPKFSCLNFYINECLSCMKTSKVAAQDDIRMTGVSRHLGCNPTEVEFEGKHRESANSSWMSPGIPLSWIRYLYCRNECG